jgi:hypothetical protein
MNEKYTLEELEAYLLGDLELNRKKQLEIDIKTDQVLLEELEALKISREAIELAGWKTLVSKNQEEFLANREQENVRSIKPEPKSTFQWFGRIAASIVFILVGFLTVMFFSVSPESITSNQLNYSIPVLRSAESNLENLEKAYQAGDYDQVIALSEGISSYDADSYFLIGLSYLEKEDGVRAEDFFNTIEAENIRNSESNYADQVDYYLVKTYLLQGKIEESEARMIKILEDQNHTYHHNFSQFDLLKIKILKLK